VSVSLETHADLLNGVGLASVSVTAAFQPAGARGTTPPPPPASGAGAVNTFWRVVPIGAVGAGASYLQAQSWATMMAADNTAAAAEGAATIGDGGAVVVEFMADLLKAA
jgi:hypothetical protein